MLPTAILDDFVKGGGVCVAVYIPFTNSAKMAYFADDLEYLSLGDNHPFLVQRYEFLWFLKAPKI